MIQEEHLFLSFPQCHNCGHDRSSPYRPEIPRPVWHSLVLDE